MIKDKQNGFTFNILLFCMVILLIGLGFGFLNSASQPINLESEEAFEIVMKQLAFLGVGFIGMFAAACIDHRFYQKHTKFFVFLTIILLIATLLPNIGSDVYGARRWIKIGKFSFQPSEFAKLTIIIYLSSVLSNKSETIGDFYVGVLPPLVLLGLISIFIFLENDFSTTVLILITGFAIFYLSGVKLITLAMLGIIGTLASFFMILVAPYRVQRMLTLFNPWLDPFGSGWQSIQSMKCFSLGGLFGRGIGESTQKYQSLPKGYNDYIFSIIAEEGGVFITVFMIALYFIIALLGINIAKRCKNVYSYLLACGISVLLFVQASMNIGVSIGIFPATGVTLPFVSAGGSSLIVFMFMIGILFNISKNNGEIENET